MLRPQSPPRLYVLVRGDLPPGLQYAQAVHAAVEYALTYPERAASTPNAVVLNVLNLEDLLLFASHEPQIGVLFHEEDLNDEATAYAAVCEDDRFSGLPLAGKQLVPMVQ